MVSLTVWARSGSPELTLENVILWEAFLPPGAPSSWVSLPELVHRDRVSLRARYQHWLAGIVDRDLDGAALPRQMAIRSNLSYWWMTLPTDNSLAVGSPAYSIVRLFALANSLSRVRPERIRIVADDPEVAAAITSVADHICAAIEVHLSEHSGGDAHRGRAHRAPWLAAGRVFWNHLCIALDPRRKAGRAPFGEGIIMVDYLAHLDSPGPDGSFRSNYWGPLVELLEEWSEPVNWLHVSANYATPAVVTADVAQTYAFNSARPGHSVLHAYLDFRGVVRALRDYIRINRWGRRLRSKPELFIERTTGIDPSPLLVELIKDQYFGRSAALNALWINLWESTLARVPHQRLGVYLFENQPWELAFIAAWRSTGHAQLVGFAHSTVPFWDLRIFRDPSLFPAYDHFMGTPSPNYVAANGPVMRQRFLEGGYTNQHLLNVEALRYFTRPHLKAREQIGPLKLLILGEYSLPLTVRLLQEIETALASSRNSFHVSFRSHPASPLSSQQVPAWVELDEHSSALKALATTDVVLCGPHSSASVEAVLCGTPTLLLMESHVFRASPAEDLDCTWVTSGPHLKSILRAIARKGRGGLGQESSPAEYFWLDPTLRRWQMILGDQPLAPIKGCES